MRTIEIDDEIYDHLVKNTREIGEGASNILRRLLEIPINPRAGASAPLPDQPTHELSAALSDSKFKHHWYAVDKYLYIFAAAYKLKPAEFEKLLGMKGWNRIYFARTREEIEKSGSSTQPRQIPGTSYWALTNSQTRNKRQQLRESLTAMGFSDAAIQAAVNALR